MTFIRCLTYLTGVTAVSGLVFGWATVMFPVGMIAALIWAITFGLLLYITDDDNPTDLTIDEIQAMRAEGWERRWHDGGKPYMRWVGAHQHQDQDEEELPYRPVWPREAGSFE